MLKWILGLLAVLVLVIFLGFGVTIWIAMAGGLQQAVEDNLTALRQDFIIEDQVIRFEYKGLAVEAVGLNPAVTLNQPRLILSEGAYDYRITAPEMTIVGSFIQLSNVKLQLPSSMTLAISDRSAGSNVMDLELSSPIAISLLAKGEDSYFWEYYQREETLKGSLIATSTGDIRHELNYHFPAGEAELIQHPYSPELLKLLTKLDNTLKAKP